MNALDWELSRLYFEKREIIFMWFLLFVTNIAQIFSKHLEDDEEPVISPLHYDLASTLPMIWHFGIAASCGPVGIIFNMVIHFIC